MLMKLLLTILQVWSQATLCCQVRRLLCWYNMGCHGSLLLWSVVSTFQRLLRGTHAQ